MAWKQRKTKDPVEFWMVDAEHRPKWRKAIYTCLATLKEEHRKVIPPIVVYPTLVEAVRDTFNPADVADTDEWVLTLLKQGSWAFSRLSRRNPEYARICLVAHMPYCMKEKVSPELSIFHEMGHFIMEDFNGIRYDGSDSMEYKVDKIAVEYYLRMLQRDPYVRSISSHDTHVRFDEWMAGCVDKYEEQSPIETEKDVSEMCSAMSEAIMDKMKWRVIYKNL